MHNTSEWLAVVYTCEVIEWLRPDGIIKGLRDLVLLIKVGSAFVEHFEEL